MPRHLNCVSPTHSLPIKNNLIVCFTIGIPGKALVVCYARWKTLEGPVKGLGKKIFWSFWLLL